jgi:hypothetical protein
VDRHLLRQIDNRIAANSGMARITSNGHSLLILKFIFLPPIEEIQKKNPTAPETPSYSGNNNILSLTFVDNQICLLKQVQMMADAGFDILKKFAISPAVRSLSFSI